MAEASGASVQRPAFEALSDLVQALPAVIYEAEPGKEGAWNYVSAHIEALLGYTPEEWMADPSLYLRSLHPDDREAVVGSRSGSCKRRGAAT